MSKYVPEVLCSRCPSPVAYVMVGGRFHHNFSNSRLDLSWKASAPIVPRHVKRYNSSQSTSPKSATENTYRMRKERHSLAYEWYPQRSSGVTERTAEIHQPRIQVQQSRLEWPLHPTSVHLNIYSGGNHLLNVGYMRCNNSWKSVVLNGLTSSICCPNADTSWSFVPGETVV